MILTKVDTDLLRLHQALVELIKMGLVQAFSDEEQLIRYRLTGRPIDDEEEEEEEIPAPRIAAACAHVEEAVSVLPMVA